MNASKENARKAQECLARLLKRSGGLPLVLGFVSEFLTAAERKLPSEAAFSRAKKSRRRLRAS